MNTLEAISSRRASRHYDPNFIIPKEDIDCLIQHMMQAPSAFNLQHYRCVWIKDKEKREQLRDAAWGQEQITEASVLLVLCADIKAWEKSPEYYWREASQEVRQLMLPMIHDFYYGKEQLQRDEALRSIGILAQTTMLAAKALGYDSCPMSGFDHQQVAEIIQLPKDHIVGMMLTIGKTTKEAHPRSGQLLEEQFLTYDSF